MSRVKDFQKKEDDKEYAYKFYISRGYTPEQSAAIVGNLLRESTLNTTAVGDSGISMGIAQWNKDRLGRLKSKYGDNWTKLDNQLDFVDWELKNTHKEAGVALKNAKGVWQAGQVISDLYERPKVKFNSDDKRQQHVADTYMKFKGTPLSEQDKILFSTKSVYDRDVAPYINSQDINLYKPNLISNIVPQGEYSVPDVYVEPTEEKKTETATQEAQVDPNADFFKKLQDFYTNSEVQQEQPQKKEEEPIQGTDVFGIFNEASQFVDNPLMREGGLHKLQQGGTLTPEQERASIAPQMPIKNILYGVETVTEKQGLPPSKGLIRVDYQNGQNDYLKPSGLDNLRRMNNYRIYMQELAKKQSLQDTNNNQMAVLQEGGELKPKDFLEDYINSPKYKERLKSSNYPNINNEISYRKNKVSSTEVQPERLSLWESIKKFELPVSRGSHYDGERINLDYPSDLKAKDKMYPTFNSPTKAEIEVHELGHAETQGLVEPYRLNEYDIRNLVGRGRKSSDINMHDRMSNENKSDLDAYRFLLKKSNIYDAGKQDFSKDILDKSPKSFTLDRLRRNYSDKNLIWLMNNIAYNKEELPNIAQEGGNIINDNNGYHNPENWGKPVQISSKNITMDNVKEPLWVIADTGELRLLKPNEKYIFKGANSVIEYPITTEEERKRLNKIKEV